MQNPQLQKYSEEAGVHYPHWRVHHIGWMAQDAHAQTCTHRTRASLLLKDAHVWHCVRVWVSCSREMGSHPLSHSHHLYAKTDDWDLNGMHAHPKMSCSREMRVRMAWTCASLTREMHTSSSRMSRDRCTRL